MFNKELFDKICNVSCTGDELERFVIGIDKKEFDLDNPFSKYYNVEHIICAIEKYQSKKIDVRFLARWMIAYDWIIMGGFEVCCDKISLKDFMEWTITDWLDGLSFFDWGDDTCYNLEEYKIAFKVLDSILKDINKGECDAVFAHRGFNDNEVIVLVTNHKAKYFVQVWGELNYIEEEICFSQISSDELDEEVNKLQQQGYSELHYCTFSEEVLEYMSM